LSPPLPGSIPGTSSLKMRKFYFKTLLGTKHSLGNSIILCAYFAIFPQATKVIVYFIGSVRLSAEIVQER